MKVYLVELSPVDFYKQQVNFGFGENKLTRLEQLVITYMYLYPDDYVERLIADGHSAHPKAIENIITVFRRNGVVQGRGRGNKTKLTTNIDFIPEKSDGFCALFKVKQESK